MTDDEFDVMSEKVEGLITLWKPFFGIENWRVNIHFYRGAIPGNEDAAGCCHSLWEYLDATLEFNLAELAENDDEQLESVVVHELLHIIVDELKTKKGSPERVVSHLSRILMRLSK